MGTFLRHSVYYVYITASCWANWRWNADHDDTDDDARATVKYLDCLERSLTDLCGPIAAVWQRDLTTKMIAKTALDPDCIVNAARSVDTLRYVLRYILPSPVDGSGG